MSLQDVRDEADQKGVSYRKSDTIAQIKKAIEKKELNDQLKLGNVTKEQLAEWKKKYGDIHRVSVEVSEGDVAIGYLKTPKRDHKAIALSLYNQHKILETGEFLIQNCWLGGDERLKNSEAIADSAAIQANGIVNFLKGSLDKV